MEQQLVWLLAEHNPPLQLGYVPGDGDCLIHAIKVATGDPDHPDAIRNKVAHYVKANKEISPNVSTGLGGRSARWWAFLNARSGEWLETDFAIFYCEMKGLRPPNFFTVGVRGQLVKDREYDPRDVNLAHHSHHYQPVLPMQNARPQPGPSAMPRQQNRVPAPGPYSYMPVAMAAPYVVAQPAMTALSYPTGPMPYMPYANAVPRYAGQQRQVGHYSGAVWF